MKAKLHIQCVDKESGVKGDFLTDIETGDTVTPVFDDLGTMFTYLRANGWVSQPYDSRYPVGLYEKDIS